MGMHYPYAEMVSFVVMPNHVHAIIRIHPSEDIPTKRTALSVVIGGFKQAVTCFLDGRDVIMTILFEVWRTGTG